MSELTEALGRWDSDPYGTDLQPIVDAARKYAALTSPETVEKGALAIVDMPYDSLELRKGDKSELFAEAKIAEAVLRAVAEDTE